MKMRYKEGRVVVVREGGEKREKKNLGQKENEACIHIHAKRGVKRNSE